MDDQTLSFKINKEIDEKVIKQFPSKNFFQMFLSWQNKNLFPLLENRFNSIKSLTDKNICFSSSLLIEAIKYEYEYEYEYGIDMTKNNQLALEFYTAASKEKNPYALYKLYTIHRDQNQNLKFQIERNKNLEIFYLLEAFAYFDFRQIGNYQHECYYFHRIDLHSEISLILKLDDPSLEKTNKLFLDMEPHVDETELRYVEAMTLFAFNRTDDDKEIGIAVLHDLAEFKDYVHAIWSLACLYIEENKFDLSRNFLSRLVEKKFFDAYSSYVLLEFNQSWNVLKDNFNDKEDENENVKFKFYKEILLDALKNFHHKSFSTFYRISLHYLAFEKDFTTFCEEIVDYMILDVINGNLFTLFEYFYIQSILKKFDPSNLRLNKSSNLMQELIVMIKNLIINESDLYSGHSSSEYLHTQSSALIYLTYAFVLYSFDKKYSEAEIYFKKSYDCLKSLKIKSTSLLRLCYYYIYKSRRKIVLLHDNIISSEIELKVKNRKDKLEKTKHKLYKNFTDEGKIDTSHFDINAISNSSFDFYVLGKIHENPSITVDKSESSGIKSFSYYHKSCNTKQLDSSIASFYKRYKAKLKIEQSTWFKEIFHNIKEMKKSRTDDDNNLCNICFEKYNEKMFLSCKHLTCKDCFDRKFKKDKKCPICRSEIITII